MSYSNKRMKIEGYYTSVKDKVATSPSTSSDNSGKSVSSYMHWKDDLSHMMNKMRLKYSTEPKAGSKGLKYDITNKGKIASQNGKHVFWDFLLFMVDGT